MTESATKWVTAEVILLPRGDGRRQSPPRIFQGYRNSNLWFEHAKTPSGWGTFALIDDQKIPEWEVHLVYAELLLFDAAISELAPGIRFTLTEGGRLVLIGTITALHDLDPRL